MQREITDTTNSMLIKNAELLKSNTIETANEANRGIVDLETLQKVNQNLSAQSKKQFRFRNPEEKRERLLKQNLQILKAN